MVLLLRSALIRRFLFLVAVTVSMILFLYLYNKLHFSSSYITPSQALKSFKEHQTVPPTTKRDEVTDKRVDTTTPRKVPPQACVTGRNFDKEKEWAAIIEESGRKTSQKSQERAEHVKQMMVHAWTGYKKHAWGANELAPISGNPHSGIFSGTRIGLTIVDSLDTLYTMGLFEEVQLGKMWLKENLTSHLNVSVQVSVFEFNIRFVGGLLSMFALTNECEYRDLAVLCADKLLPAFETPHGIPVAHIDLKHGLNTRFTNFGNAILSEFGTLHLEFFYLSYITGEFKYRNLVENIREKVTKANVNGLYGNHFSINTAKYMSSNLAVSLGGAGDSFYEYLFKSYLQSGKTDTHALKLYFDAMEAIIKEGLLQTSGGGLRYFGMKHTGLSHNAQRRMEHLACFIGGVIGLSAEYSKNQTATLQLAEDIATTCHESYVRAASGIGPESFEFDTSKGDAVSAGGDSGYHMRPEVVETWFFLSRVTKDRKYREWCWDFIKALDKYCKVKDGYVGLHDVYLRRTDSKGEPLKEDVQQSYFMAETLKYLYLIYKDESLLSLDSWVFNTEAHPLPVLHPFS